MKIYTKKGDGGQTMLIGGTKVYKNDLRIDSYGNVDELNSHIGVIMSVMGRSCRQRKVLQYVQNCLFVVGSHLADDKRIPNKQLPQLNDSDVTLLEQEIDRMTARLPELKTFILPGGSLLASFTHVARCVCRRTERAVVALSQKEKVDPIHIIYLNRLSDYLYVLARFCNHLKGVRDVPWLPAS